MLSPAPFPPILIKLACIKRYVRMEIGMGRPIRFSARAPSLRNSDEFQHYTTLYLWLRYSIFNVPYGGKFRQLLYWINSAPESRLPRTPDVTVCS